MEKLSNDIKNKIIEVETLTFSEKKFLTTFINSYYHKYSNYKINELSKEIGFSTSVINRAFSKIGHKSWSYFRPLISNNSLDDIDYTFDKDRFSLDVLWKTLDVNNIDKLRLLYKEIKISDKIILYADGSSYYFAQLFARNLFKNGKNSIVISGLNNNDLIEKNRSYLLINITLSGKNEAGHHQLKELKRLRNVSFNIWTITGNNAEDNEYFNCLDKVIYPLINYNNNELERELPSTSATILIHYISKIIDFFV